MPPYFLTTLIVVPERLSRTIRVFLAPHEGRLEFRKLVSLQLLSVEDQPDDVLGQQSEGAEVEDFIAMIVNKLQHLLKEELGAFVLDISLRGGEECTHSVHCDAALRERRILFIL